MQTCAIDGCVYMCMLIYVCEYTNIQPNNGITLELLQPINPELLSAPFPPICKQ